MITLEKNSKSNDLIKLLQSTDKWLPCSTIAEQLSLSTRQVRYLISKINEQESIILSSNKGYRINHTNTFIHEENQNFPTNYEERKKFIYRQLVIKNEIMDIDALADSFGISSITFRNEMEKWKRELKNYNIHLKTKQGKLFSIAKESDRKDFALNVIRDELDQTSFSTENVKKYFKHVNLSDIRQIVLGVFTKHQCYVDHYSLLTYIIHLAIRIELSYDNPIEKDEHQILHLNVEEYSDPEITKIVTEITKELSQYYKNANFSINDIMDASLLMSTRIVSKEVDLYELNDSIEKVVDIEMSSLLNKIIETIYNTYSIDLNSQQFNIRFALHLKNVLIRADKKLTLKNQQFNDIKNKYPFLYVISVNIAYIIQQETGHVLSEDEIAYITLHVGVILEEQKVQQQKIICALVVPDYYVIGKNLYKKIENLLGNLIYIETMVTNTDELKNHEFDALISTYDLTYSSNVPVILVDPFLNEHNVDSIRSKVRNLQIIKKRNASFKNFKSYLNKDLCFFNKGFKNSKEAIETICDYLYSNNLINNQFKAEIYNHEKIAPSSYNNIAIAHTLSNNDIASFVALSINKTPVIWGENSVNLIFIVSLKKDNRSNFRALFSTLTDIISDNEIYQQMLNTNSFEELEQIFTHYE
ncbi:MAG: PTS sugar transporter subunit IIA [Erysipelotrichaceae bacterium]|nr:PTS sugar transporter subunit IIA [Erysipelotrichaceae bacterium]